MTGINKRKADPIIASSIDIQTERFSHRNLDRGDWAERVM